MRVHIGTDHAGIELKNYLARKLTEAGYDVVDHGAISYVADDDYPDFIIPVAEAVAEEFPVHGSMGIVLGGSGNGEQIAANKVKGIRCAHAVTTEFAELGRKHNNANIISLAGRFTTHEDALSIVKLFLTTEFSGEPRHERRIQKIADYENK